MNSSDKLREFLKIMYVQKDSKAIDNVNLENFSKYIEKEKWYQRAKEFGGEFFGFDQEGRAIHKEEPNMEEQEERIPLGWTDTPVKIRGPQTMKGNNKLDFCEAEVIQIVQYYLDNVMLTKTYKAVVVGVEANKVNNITDGFTVSLREVDSEDTNVNS